MHRHTHTQNWQKRSVERHTTCSWMYEYELSKQESISQSALDCKWDFPSALWIKARKKGKCTLHCRWLLIGKRVEMLRYTQTIQNRERKQMVMIADVSFFISSSHSLHFESCFSGMHTCAYDANATWISAKLFGVVQHFYKIISKWCHVIYLHNHLLLTEKKWWERTGAIMWAVSFFQ